MGALQKNLKSSQRSLKGCRIYNRLRGIEDIGKGKN